MYGDHEVEHRIKKLSITTNIQLAFSHATEFEFSKGGLVLGIEVDDSIIQGLYPDETDRRIMYIPRKLSIEELKIIYLSPVAFLKHLPQLCEEFEKYNPRYLTILP